MSRDLVIMPMKPEKKGMARVFAVQVQSLLGITSDGGTSLIGAGKLSRYRIFVGGTGAVSRYKLTTEPENCHGAESLLRVLARSQG